MKLLLDTQAFIWWVNDSPNLSFKSRECIGNAHQRLFLSLASVWELAIKSSLGKIHFKQPLDLFLLDQLRLNSIRILDIRMQHVLQVKDLPFHHRDPFDRLIISQALLEKIPVISSDKTFDQYSITRIW